MIARPSAASSRIEPSDRPLKAWPSRSPTSSRRLTWARLVAAAMRTPSSGSTAGSSRFSRRVRASGSPDSPSRRTAERRSAGSGSPSCRLARARPRASFTPASLSIRRRASSSGRCAALAVFCNCCAAACRSGTSLATNWWLARAVLSRPRRRLFRRSGFGSPSGRASPSAAWKRWSAPRMNGCWRLSSAMRLWRSASRKARRPASGVAAQCSSRWARPPLSAAAKSCAGPA